MKVSHSANPIHNMVLLLTGNITFNEGEDCQSVQEMVLLPTCLWHQAAALSVVQDPISCQPCSCTMYCACLGSACRPSGMSRAAASQLQPRPACGKLWQHLNKPSWHLQPCIALHS